jgi:hypothetical protein
MEYQKNMNLFQRIKRYHELFLQEYEEVEITKRAMANRDMKAMADSAAKGKEMYKERQQLLQGFPAWLLNQWMLNIRPMVKPFGIGYMPLFLFKLKEWMTGGDIKEARGRKILEDMDRVRQGKKTAPKEDDSSKGAGS